VRKRINLIGGGFQHTVSTNDMEPKYIEWVKGNLESDISIYVDSGILGNVNPELKNYGWLCESKTILPSLYHWCYNNTDILKLKFNKVFTHDKELASYSDIFQLTQSSGKSFIEHGEIYHKSKLVSMIASNKTMCPDHLYRQKIIQKYSGKCDHFGRGFNEIVNKEGGLKDYCFSIAIENGTYSNMFTEKLTDCFMTGTIPIYHGIPNIDEFFDINGIIILDNNFKIGDLTFELYNSKMVSIKKNLELSLDLLVAEDYIYKKYIEPYE